MTSTAQILVNAAIYGDAAVSKKENNFSPRLGTNSQERLCVVSFGFLNCLPLRISSPNSVGRLNKPHFDLFMQGGGTFSEFCLSFRFQLAQSDFKFLSHLPQATSRGRAGEDNIDENDESGKDKNATEFDTKFFDQFLKSNFAQLKILDLSWNTNYLSDFHLKKLAQSNPRFLSHTLEELDLSGNTRVSPRGLAQLVYIRNDDTTSTKTEILESSPERKNLLRRLKVLRLQRCPWIDDQGLRNSISKIKSLRHLDLSATNISAGEFASLLDLVNLQSLDLESCGRVDDFCFRNMLKEQKKRYDNNGNNNKQDSSSTTMGTPQVSTFSDMVENKMNESLMKLNLKNNNLISDVAAKIISELFVNLRELLLTNCARVTHLGISEVAHNCELLERLDIVSVPNAKTMRFGQQQQQRNQQSNNNNDDDDEENTKMMVSNKVLEEDLWHLSDLKTLMMGGYSNIRDSSFCTFLSRSASCLKSGKSPLVVLDIGNCKQLRESSLEAIGENCPHLERLVLASHGGIEKSATGRFNSANYGTDEERDEAFSSFRKMILGLKNLKSLDVTETLISDYCLKCLAENCPLMQVLTVSMSVKLSDGGLIFLRHLKNLKHVHAFRCPLITRRGVEVLMMCLPGIVVTGVY